MQPEAAAMESGEWWCTLPYDTLDDTLHISILPHTFHILSIYFPYTSIYFHILPYTSIYFHILLDNISATRNALREVVFLTTRKHPKLRKKSFLRSRLKSSPWRMIIRQPYIFQSSTPIIYSFSVGSQA